VRLDHLLSKELQVPPEPITGDGKDLSTQLVHWPSSNPPSAGRRFHHLPELLELERCSPLFRCEGASPRVGAFGVADEAWSPREDRPSAPEPLENCRASTSIYTEVFFQATKSQRWMPWRLLPMKDVDGCDKPREAAYQALIRGCPNGETRCPSWGITLV
jgi:hypothetical protein